MHVSSQDNDNKMAYDVAQLNNQHRCFRFLTSVHWARKKDDMDLKQCKKETVVKKAKLRNEKLCLQLKQGRGAKAFSKWLSDKAIASVKTEPMECEERKRTRLASVSLSACTYCSTIAASRGQSASSSSLKITPIKITPHQESRNLDFIGKPVKMLPYANYVKKSLHSKKPTASRHSKVGSKVSVSKIISRKSLSAGKISQRGAVKQVNGECAKGPGCSGSNDPLVEHGNTAMLRKMSSKSSRSEDNLLARHMFGPDQVAAASIGNKPMDINKNTNFLEDRLGVICKKGKGFKKEYHNCGGDDNGNSGMDDTDDDDYDDNDSDSDYNEGDCDSNEADDERDKDVDSESDDDDDNDDVSIRFYSEEPDNNDSLSCLQFNFNAEDENSFFHDVGPMNDLNSLALPPVLTKGRTPAEVLQIIRRLEHSSNNQGKQKTRRRSFSVSGSAGRSRHLNRRFSLGSIPEGEILYNYGNGYEASDDDDKVDSMVLLNLESIIGSISGRQEEKEEKERSEHLEDVEEKHQAQRESRLAETNGGTSDMAQGVPEQLSMESGNTPSCFTDKDSPRPSLSTLKIVNLEWDAATNSVHSDVSLSPLTTAPLHRRSSSSSTLSPADTGESNPGTPERRITPPSIKMTNRMIASAPPTGTVVRKTTPLSRKISPPILSNAEVTLLTKTIQEMQVEMASKKSDVDHKRKKTVHSEEKITSSAKMKAFSSGSDRGNETSTSSLSSPFAVSFSDPCMKLPSSIDWETKSMSPDQVQKTSFYIGDSDSSSSEVSFRWQHSSDKFVLTLSPLNCQL